MRAPGIEWGVRLDSDTPDDELELVVESAVAAALAAFHEQVVADPSFTDLGVDVEACEQKLADFVRAENWRVIRELQRQRWRHVH